MDNTENIRVLSLCTGYGGLELALARIFDAPLKVVSVERECFPVANLVAKAEQNKLDIIANYTDVKTFPSEKFRECFDIVAAGFPCQGFSSAGKRRGGFDPRHLWPHIAKHIGTIKPFRVCLENVPGLLSTTTLDNRPDLLRYLAELGKAEKGLDAKGKWYLSQHRERFAQHLLHTEGVPAYGAIYYSLRDLGYKVEAGLFTASEIGAPHKRERLFILAYSNDRQLESELQCNRAEPKRSSELANSLNNGYQGQIGGINGETNGIQGENRQTRSRSGESVGTTRLGRKGTSRRVLDKGKIQSSKEKLAESDCSGYIYGESQEQSTESWLDAQCKSKPDSRMADTEHAGQHKGKKHQARQVARPGQAQYEWEEPRTVKPGMGRTVDGFKSRVDELRLLGNGVVPAQAELAFRSLINIIRIGD